MRCGSIGEFSNATQHQIGLDLDKLKILPMAHSLGNLQFHPTLNVSLHYLVRLYDKESSV